MDLQPLAVLMLVDRLLLEFQFVEFLSLGSLFAELLVVEPLVHARGFLFHGVPNCGVVLH